MTRKTQSWYTIQDIDQVDTPALVIYQRRVKKNIRLLRDMINDSDRLRPHVKTHKTKEVTFLLMEAGINKFKCATIAEAEMLGMCGARDVLLAYPVFGPKLHRFIRLIEVYASTNFSCLIDNRSSAEQISKVAMENKLTIDVFIDLNVGMNRTGIKPGKEAVQLYIDANQYDGLKVQGFHVYDGHIREKDLQERIVLAERAFAPVEAMSLQLKEKGYKEPKVIVGGSPTFPIHAKREKVECSPGTFIFWDMGYQNTLPEQKFLPAALIVTRVISLPDEKSVCLDVGYKAIASENNLNNRICFLNKPILEAIGQSEEHLVLEVPEDHSWKVGDVLYGVPVHICPTCALYEKAVIVEEGKVIDKWEIISRARRIEI